MSGTNTTTTNAGESTIQSEIQSLTEERPNIDGEADEPTRENVGEAGIGDGQKLLTLLAIFVAGGYALAELEVL